MVVHITPAKAGGWHASMYIENTNPIPVHSVLVGGSTVEINSYRGRYQGEISADGSSIRGVWISGNPQPRHSPEPLELQRATRHTAWSLPPDSSPHTTRYVTVDKDVSLEVLDWGGSGRPLVLLAGLGERATQSSAPVPPVPPIAQEVNAGFRRYTRIPVPILAIFRVVPGWKQSDAFEKGVPSARVVRLAHASHRIFLSNETDVLREMNAFISGLPR